MASFKDARNLLLESYDDGIIDDDEYILLYEQNFSKNPEFPYEDYERFDLDAMDDTECKADFRFTKNEILRLAEALNIPETFLCHQGTTPPGIEGLCLLLRRLTYPCRYSDLIPRFGRPGPELLTLLTFLLTYLLHRIHRWDRQTNLSSWRITKSRIEWS